MSYEIWSAGRYGKSFSQPQDKLAGDLTEGDVYLRLNLGFTGHLLHNLLVVHEAEVTRANHWLDDWKRRNA